MDLFYPESPEGRGCAAYAAFPPKKKTKELLTSNFTSLSAGKEQFVGLDLRKTAHETDPVIVLTFILFSPICSTARV